MIRPATSLPSSLLGVFLLVPHLLLSASEKICRASLHCCTHSFRRRPQIVLFGNLITERVISSLLLGHWNTFYEYYFVFVSQELTYYIWDSWYSEQNHNSFFHFSCPLTDCKTFDVSRSNLKPCFIIWYDQDVLSPICQQCIKNY